MSEIKTEAEHAHDIVTLRCAMQTDIGLVREHNEDSAWIDEDMRFFVVADGMGGHAAGEVASAMAVQTVRTSLEEQAKELEALGHQPTPDKREQIGTILEKAVRSANLAVFDRGQAEVDKAGMGTTLEVVLICGAEAFIAHVGDSRTYLMRGTSASQITTDHTVAEVLVIEGKLSAEDALESPMRTVLVNALGVAADVVIEMAHLTLRKDDRLLICSDGLHDHFPAEQELFDGVVDMAPDAALAQLVSVANERGGHDNITAVLVHVVDAPNISEAQTIPMAAISLAKTAPNTEGDAIPEVVSKSDTLPVESHSAVSSVEEGLDD